MNVDLPRRQLRTLHLFAGAGGGILADIILGHVPVCAVELDAYCRRVLVARQRDGSLPRFPIWDDVTTFDGRSWGGAVDVVSGGFPCTDISAAGRGAGIDGKASGLWSEMARIVGEVRPRYVFVENSPVLTSRGLGRVLGDLAALGFDAEWDVLGADDVGAPHVRKRIWIVAAHPDRVDVRELAATRLAAGKSNLDDAVVARSLPTPTTQDAENNGSASQSARNTPPLNAVAGGPLNPAFSESLMGWPVGWTALEETPGPVLTDPWDGDWEGGRPRIAHDIPNRVARLRAIGNGQVPQCAALAWRILTS